MISQDDDFYILNSFEKIIKNIPDIRIHQFTDRGHFVCSELPEILSIIK